MMSRPDRVQVDRPRTAGTMPLTSADSDLSGSAEEDTSVPPSIPWTIGATDGTYATLALSTHHEGGWQIRTSSNGNGALIDQAGVRQATPSPPPPTTPPVRGAAIGAMGEPSTLEALSTVKSKRSLYHDRLLHPSSPSAEACLGAACEVMGFDIAEMWLRTGAKTHQLTNSHLRPTSLDDSVRNELVDVYYGERSSERTHLLSPALCKRAKEAMDVVWVTAQTPSGAEALKISISDVRTAVAVPVCHEPSNTNMTIIYFSIRRNIMRPTAVEFLVHMSLAAAVASVNPLAEEGLIDRPVTRSPPSKQLSQSEHMPQRAPTQIKRLHEKRSITGAQLDLQWRQLQNVEYLTDGGNSWIHTAVLEGRPVVVKTLKPECQDVVLAINEIEGELALHARLNHPNICTLLGAGRTTTGVRFVVLERLDGGTMSQMLGYDNRIRDRRRRFWRKKQFSFVDVLRCAKSIADAFAYLHGQAIPGSMVLHRDLKPDNIGFTLNGQVKIIDFGLARVVDHAEPTSDEVYTMSGETGSLRYMAPEVAKTMPYNHKADVYSFGIILWELNSCRKPFEGMDRDQFYERVIKGMERPPINRKWPGELVALMASCWSPEIASRPTFDEISLALMKLLKKERKGSSGGEKKSKRILSGLIDRHSTWF